MASHEHLTGYLFPGLGGLRKEWVFSRSHFFWDNKMHYYNFNIADYRKDTVHLSRVEHWIYRELIDLYYLDEKPIETQMVIRRLRLDSESDKLALQNVLNDFFYEEKGVFKHKRIEQDIKQYHQKSKTNRENGKKGGRPKSINTGEKTQSVIDRLANVNQSESESNPNQEPITNNHKPIKEKNIKKENPDFDAFWKAYPRKTAKKNAEQAWKKVSTPLDTILNAIDRQKKTQQWIKDNGAFIPHPATWLNQERWNDQLEFKQENNLGKYV